MRFTYEVLLSLYPASWVVQFGREMSGVFEQAARDYRSRGLVALWTFLMMEFGGLIVGAVAEWSGEGAKRARDRSKTVAIALTAAVAAVIAWGLQGGIYQLTLHRKAHVFAPRVEPLQPQLGLLALLALIGAAIVGVSFLSLVFVWNMRKLGNRTGELRPIWMPGRAAERLSRRERERRKRIVRERRPGVRLTNDRAGIGGIRLNLN